jgi:hypothetical protein
MSFYEPRRRNRKQRENDGWFDGACLLILLSFIHPSIHQGFVTYSDDEGIPHGVEVALGLAKLDRDVVATPILARIVQGLVDVADKVDKETEGIAEDGSLAGGGWRLVLEVLHGRGHVEQAVDNIETCKVVGGHAAVWGVVTRAVDVVEDTCPPGGWLLIRSQDEG